MEKEKEMGGHFLQLSTSSNGLLELNEGSCHKLFNSITTANIIAIINEPKSNHSLMKNILQHGFEMTESKTSKEAFQIEFEISLSKLKQESIPQLVTWSIPILASNEIPTFVLGLAGHFSEPFINDPDLIALLGLALATSSTIVFVVNNMVQLGTMETLYPIVIQGLRSEQICIYQQLYILVNDGNLFTFGLKGGDVLLKEFWNSNWSSDRMVKLQNLFQTISCFIQPPVSHKQFQLHCNSFLNELVDVAVIPKHSKNNQIMNGDEIVRLLKKHANKVTDASFEDFGSIYNEKVAQKEAFADNFRDSFVVENFDSKEDTQDSEEIPEYNSKNGKHINNLSLSMAKINLQEYTQASASSPKVKFSDRFKKFKTDDTKQTQITNTIETDPIDQEIQLETQIKQLQTFSNENQTNAIQRLNSKIIEQKDETFNTKEILQQLHQNAIDLINPTQEKSDISVTEIMTKAEEKLPTQFLQEKEKLQKCIATVAASVEGLIEALNQFQTSLQEFNVPEIKYESCLKKKLEKSFQSYTTIFEENYEKIKKQDSEILEFLIWQYSNRLKEHFQNISLTEKENEKFKGQLNGEIFEILENLLRNAFNNKLRLQVLQKQLEFQMQSEFLKQKNEFMAKVISIKTEISLAIDNCCSSYKTMMAEAQKKAYSLNNFKELHLEAVDKILDMYRKNTNEISKELAQNHEHELKQRLDEFYLSEKESFKDYVKDSSKTSTLKCIAPSKVDFSKKVKNIPTSSKIHSQPANGKEIAIGVHFGLVELSVFHWDKNKCIPIIDTCRNVMSYCENEFKICSNSGRKIDMGQLFTDFYKLEFEIRSGLPILHAEELVAIMMCRIRRKVESYLEKKVTSFVIAIPEFAGEAHYKIISLACELVRIPCKIISEIDACAIQYLHNVVSSNKVSSPHSCLITILRNDSYDVAGFSLMNGIIHKHVAHCHQDTGLGGKAAPWLKSFFVNEFEARLKTMKETLPMKSLLQTSIVPFSESKDLANSILEKIQDSKCFVHPQLLSICVTKGAAYWGDFLLKNENSKQLMSFDSSLIVGGRNTTKPIVRNKRIYTVKHFKDF